MKNWILGVMIGMLWIAVEPSWAAGGAVKIDAISDGRAIDANALRAVRQVVGRAIASGTVDNFYVYSPKIGGPIPVEGGLSACAEFGFSATATRFDTFVKRLGAIRPQPGTTIRLALASSCSATMEPLSCGGITGKVCPSGQFCADDPRDSCDPATGGADCSGICKVSATACPQDAKLCPDGLSYVSRVPPSCDFAPCPVK